MIDLTDETIITLPEAARRLPRRRRGRPVAVQTLYRWTTRGLRGVRLETIQIGGTRCTSAEAMQRFFDRLGDASQPAAAPADRDDRRDQQVERDLDDYGL